ncbi:MAG: hypothetical protein D6691_09785 [Candidatus Hydrogenedentota bacterium]|nr:MAG: hypothetical protein D6691_09785 [Candidatus Hydrogenedentota bacterium]
MSLIGEWCLACCTFPRVGLHTNYRRQQVSGATHEVIPIAPSLGYLPEIVEWCRREITSALQKSVFGLDKATLLENYGGIPLEV